MAELSVSQMHNRRLRPLNLSTIQIERKKFICHSTVFFQIKDLSFSHKSMPELLHNISLEACKGETIALIGENGCELSGGERQRISIARAFLKNSPIILLDEATASLDVENETLIQAALSRLIKDKTVLVIAHRMRTVSGADKVIVLSDGTVAEQGKPEDLMNTGRIYPHMVKLQMISQDWGI